QLLTRSPRFSPEGPALTGRWSTSFNSADMGLGSYLVANYATPRFALLATGSGRRGNELRPGEGRGPHAPGPRFLGVDSRELMDERLPDTAFDHYGGSLKASWATSLRSHW